MRNFLTVALMLAVMGYTVFNYATGKISATYFLVYMVILGFPLINTVRLMIRQHKDGE